MRAALVLGLALAAVAGLLLVTRGGSTERATNRTAAPEPAAAEAPPAPVAPPDLGDVPARGRVFDGEWTPVAGATVESDTARATTDADGAFAMPEGTRRAKVSAPGYVTVSVHWSTPARPLEVVLARGGTLAGTVRDASGRPVPGTLVRSGEVEATAGGDGRYALEGVAAGFLDAMRVRAPGRVWQSLARLPEVPVRAGQTTEFDPVVEAGVTVEGTAPPHAAVLLDKDPARADGGGRFRFDGVLPGRHWIRLDPGVVRTIDVGPDGLSGLVLEDAPRATLRVTGASDAVMLRIAGNEWRAEPGQDGCLVFENVLAAARASLIVGAATDFAIALPPGETTVFEIPPPDLVFEGVVEAPDGSGLPGAEVVVLDEAAEFRRWMRPATAAAGGAGRFRIEVRSRARSFALVAKHPDFAPALLRRLDRSSDRLSLRLGHGLAIEGTVRYEDGEPASRAWLVADHENPLWGDSTGADDPIVGDLLDAGPPREHRVTRADEQGRFRIDGLSPGTYWIGAREVEAGGPPLALVRTRHEDVSIAGIVVDPRGARVAEAIVSTGEASAGTDTAGRFRIDGLAAGPHDLAVTPPTHPFASGRFFEPATARGIVAPRDDVVIRVGDGRTLEGRILDADGAPLGGASVKVLPPPPPDEAGVRSPPATPVATTDASGRYELRGLPPGPLEIAVFRGGHLPIVLEAKGDDAGTHRLRRGESIGGILLDAQGKPAPRLTLQLNLKEAANPADVAPWRRVWQQYGPWFDVQTVDDGRFAAAGLPAGEYEVVGNDMAPVRTPSGTSNLELRLLPLHTITGVVVDEHGRGVCRSGHERLKISAHHARGQVGYIPLAEDGSFRFDRVPQGRIRLHVIGWERFESKEVVVEAGAQDVRVQLSPRPHRDR